MNGLWSDIRAALGYFRRLRWLRRKPEDGWAPPDVDPPVRKIADLGLEITEGFEDYPAIRKYIRRRR